MLLALILLAAPAAVSPPPLAPLTPAADGYPTSKGTVGVHFALPSGGAPTIGGTYFINNDVAADVDFGLDAPFSPSGQIATFSIAVGLRFYQAKHDRVGVFLEPLVAFGREVTAPATGAEFISFGGGVGVEYFFTNNFSAGAQLQLLLRLSNIGGPTGSSVFTDLSTRTSSLFANIYF